MRFLLIPVGYRRYVIGQGFEPAGVTLTSTERLDGHAQIARETNGIHDVPAVQAPFVTAIAAAAAEGSADVGRRIYLG